MFWSIIVCLLLYAAHKIYSQKAPLKLNKDSVVVITGACMGIGKLTAIQLALRHKCKIVIIDIADNLFETVTSAIKAVSPDSDVSCFKCDLTQLDQMNTMIGQIQEKYPNIALLINNAGIVIPKPFDDTKSYQMHKKTMEVNYLAPVHLSTSLMDNLKGGHIVTIASIASLLRGRNLSSYVASKHAIYAYFNCARVDLLESTRKISFSLVCPYAINTGMFDGFETRLNKIIPMLEEKDVANTIADTCVNRDEVVFLPFYLGFLVKLLSMLPELYLDLAYAYLDRSDFKNNKGMKHE